jgi:hypothetical protein
MEAVFEMNNFVCSDFRSPALFAYGEKNFCGGVRLVLTDCAKQVPG